MIKSRLIYYLLAALLIIPWNGFSQGGGNVTGVVKDAQSAVIPGVSVIIKGTTKGTTTDADGKFSIQVSEDNDVLIFSFVGFKSQEVNVRNQTQVSVTLEEDVSTLQEIVVIGYGEAKKSDLTGAVAQVKSSNLSPTVSTSVDNLLKGRVSGLQVLSPSGQPGAGTTMRIRGTNSFAGGSDPLLVVDGMPIGDAGNLKQINPNDIETIDVLKDASATAIYGSRGANGVIMVTTKRGAAGQTTIEGNYQFSLATLQKPMNIITDPYLYAELQNEAAANYDALGGGANTQRYVGKINPDNSVYYPSLSEIQSGKWKTKTNWPDQIFRKAQTQNVSIAARGGSDLTQYSISLGYLGQQGLVIGNDYKRYTANINLDQRLRKNIKAGVNVNTAFINNTESNTSGSIAGAIGRSPVFPVTDSLGNYFHLGPLDFGNPLAVKNKILDKGKSFDLFASAFAEWEIIKGLKFRTNLRTKYGQASSDYYEPSDFGGAGNAYLGDGKISSYNSMLYVIDNYITYNKTLADKHTFSVMIGNSYQSEKVTQTNMEGRGFVNDFLQNQDLKGAANKIITNSFSPTQLASYFGRLNYNFSDRYLLTATIRADGSSKFGSDNHFGYFPSLGAAWNIHNESFFPKSEVISTFKVRGGWGITGNQSALSPYQTKDRLSSGLYWMGGKWQTGYGPGVPGSADQQGRIQWEGIRTTSLKWETTRQINIGADVGLFNQKVRVTFEYYDKFTHGLLRQVVVPGSSGYNRKWQNDGEISNKGVELAIDADIISSGDFSWSAGFNISHNKNIVVKAEQNVSSYQGRDYVIPAPFGGVIESLRATPNNLANGQPMFGFYGYKTDGIIQTGETPVGLTGNDAKPGEIKYVDTDGNGVVNDYDRQFIGNPNPKFFFGFNTNAQYKNFQLRVFLTGNYGNDILNVQKLNQATSQYQRWTPDNPTNDYPRLLNNRSLRMSDYFIENGSYLKIQNISLSYNFKLNGKTVIKSLRLNANVENVWQFSKFSGYDPEIALNASQTSGGYGVYGGVGYPRARMYTMGVNFTF